MDEAIPAKIVKPGAIIVPHAGYVFCGQIMADAYRQAEGNNYDLVVILGTNHTTPDFSGVSVYAKGGFETPLGIVKIDEAVAAELLTADKEFVFDQNVHEKEHSVEVQVPYVQQLFPKAKILPIVIGEPDVALCTKLGKALAKAVRNKNVLLVASSDLSHYPSFEDACRVDRETLKAVATLNPEAVRSTVGQQMRKPMNKLSTCACGEAPILATIVAAKALGFNHGSVVGYANSGDASVGDYDRVVGYGAVVVSAGSEAPDTTIFREHDLAVDSALNISQPLSKEDKVALLSHARKTIEWYLTSKTTPLSRPFSFAANIHAGAFVTLKEKGRLRGCIGHMAEDMPLCRDSRGNGHDGGV